MGNKWPQGSTDWHGDADVLDSLKAFLPDNNNDAAPVSKHLKSILCTLERELPPRNVHLNIGYLGGNHDLAKLPSRVFIFKVMLTFLSITPESELTLLTSSCLDKETVAQNLIQKLRNAIMDNNRLKEILHLQCKGSMIWMDVFANKEDADLPECYMVKLVPAFRCSRGRHVDLYTPAKQGTDWKRSYAVEEKVLVENKGYQNFQKVIYIVKMLFANESVLAPLKSAVITATEAEIKVWTRDWRKENTLTHCIMDTLKHISQSLPGGKLDHHSSGGNILSNFTQEQRDKMDGRLERLIFNKTKFIQALDSAKNFRKDRKQVMGPWAWMMVGLMVVIILAMVFRKDWISKSMDQVCTPEGRLERHLPWICSSYQEGQPAPSWRGRHMGRILSSGKHQIEKACGGENLSPEQCIKSLNGVIQKLQAVEEINSQTGSGHQNEDVCPECKRDLELWGVLNLLLVIYVTFILVVVLVWGVDKRMRRNAGQNE